MQAVQNTATDLFGEHPIRQSRRARTEAPPVHRRKAPDVSGGMFELNDSLTPERFSSIFNSGASAYYDALGFINTGRDVGVVATLLSQRTTDLLASYLKRGGKMFCDSGAFGQFQAFIAGKEASPVADFEAVFAAYDRLIESCPIANRLNLSIVAPDIVGDCAGSIAILAQHRDRVLGYIAAGVNVIVPVQKGVCTANDSVCRIKAILGTGDFTLGIPSAAEAMSLADAATIRDHRRFHILGLGAMGLPLFQRAYAVLEHNPGATISCDATQILSHQPWISQAHAALVEKHAPDCFQDGAYDETEIMIAILDDAGWMTAKEIEALAAFYRVNDVFTVRAWARAHKAGALRELVEEQDPEATMLFACGIAHVFGEAAIRALSARLRADAIVEVFGARAAA